MAGKSVLVVAAHPDDEVLGCGGTLAWFVAQNYDVHILFVADGVGSRYDANNEIANLKMAYIDSEQPGSLKIRREAARKSSSILGIRTISFCDFPDNKLDSVSLLEVVRSVESSLNKIQPQILITHHHGDLNIDHQIVHQACMTASRPQPGHCIDMILCFEIPSSTEWQTPSPCQAFVPNCFVDISKFLHKKKEALAAYSEEIREWPHSRSYQAINHLNRWRGASIGVDAAEAFMAIRLKLNKLIR